MTNFIPEIHSVSKALNGWVANREYDGPIFIAKTLHELADLAEGVRIAEPADKGVTCFQVTPSLQMQNVIGYLEQGRRIDAIIALRGATTPMLSLKTAKALIDALYPYNYNPDA
mgnify:FL=1